MQAPPGMTRSFDLRRVVLSLMTAAACAGPSQGPPRPAGRQVLLRQGGEGPELIAVDLDALLATATPVATPAVPGPDPERPDRMAIDRFWESAAPCPEDRQLRRRAHPLGTEYACVDPAGRRDGRYAVVGAGGPELLGAYRRDLRTGVWLVWDFFGGAIASSTFVADQVEGPQRRWHPGGALRERSRWHRSRRIWVEQRYAGGALAHTLEWVDRQRREAWWTPDGAPWSCSNGDRSRPDACP